MAHKFKFNFIDHSNRVRPMKPIKHRSIELKGHPVQKVVLVQEMPIEEEIVPIIPPQAVMVCSSSDFDSTFSAQTKAFINELIEINNMPCRPHVDDIRKQVGGLFHSFSTHGSKSWRFAVA